VNRCESVMEELLKKFKLCVKKVLQDHVANGLPVDDLNSNGTDLLLSMEEILRYGLQCMLCSSYSSPYI
jgi:Zn-dependent M16 (insulinase) family peptidase